MIRTFCRETDVGDETGLATCPAFKAVFEIDDRGKCVWVITDS